jgi:nitrate/TMAO reductase-like tetraheme cytochrome c subunit
MRKKKASSADLTVLSKSSEEGPQLSKSHWARMIKKVYEVDPLECPNCHQACEVLEQSSGANNFLYRSRKYYLQDLNSSWFIGKRLWLWRKSRTVS